MTHCVTKADRSPLRPASHGIASLAADRNCHDRTRQYPLIGPEVSNLAQGYDARETLTFLFFGI
jgi:hypothetical protein